MTIRISLEDFLKNWQAGTPVEKVQFISIFVVLIIVLLGIVIDALSTKQRFWIMRWAEGRLTFLSHWNLWSATVQRYAEEIVAVWALSPCAGRPVKDDSHNWKDAKTNWECTVCHATIAYGEEPWMPGEKKP